jgi:hypothetical protein
MSLTPQQAVDHIILAVPDLKEATENFYRVSGVLPSYGGQHKGSQQLSLSQQYHSSLSNVK